MDQPRCSAPSCDRTATRRAAVMCEKHYYRMRRNGTLKLTVKAWDEPDRSHCEHCGERIPPEAAFSRKWCSARCEARARRGRPNETRRCDDCSGDIPPSRRIDAKTCPACARKRSNAAAMAAKRKARRPAPRCWRVCARCGDPFASRAGRVYYCSRSCMRAVVQQRRRASKAGATLATVRPADIFRRDGWRCGICGQRTPQDKRVPHPLAATIDHIVPLSLGGHHEPGNVRCAHFRCNSVRGAAMGAGVQPGLF